MMHGQKNIKLFALLIQGKKRKWESEVPRLWEWRLWYYRIRSGRLFLWLPQSLREASPKSVVCMAELEAASLSLNLINFSRIHDVTSRCHSYCNSSLPYFIHI